MLFEEFMVFNKEQIRVSPAINRIIVTESEMATLTFNVLVT